MKTLKGKTALITGASRGIGIYIAKALAEEGMNLVLVARKADSLEEVASKLRSPQITITCIASDIGLTSELQTLVERAETESKGIDVLINNAGLDIAYPYDKLDIDVLNQIINVNLKAPMILSRLFLPKMIERGRGHIVNISSLSGLVGTPYGEAYASSKHGLIGFTRSLRLTAIGESYPVGVSVICPGFISKTGMFDDVSKESGLEAPAILGTSPPEDVSKAVIYAIKKNKCEVIVNSKPVRPLLIILAIIPSLATWITRKTGSLKLFSDFAQHAIKNNLSSENKEK